MFKTKKTYDEIPQYYLHLFSQPNGSKEFVIISEEPYDNVVEEYATDGYEHDESMAIDDATTFPCDRRLIVE